MSSEENLEDLPSHHFAPRIYGVGAWTDHLHFAYDLVALVRPRVLVELGVDRGESYFAFCQSALENGTDSRCFAVDTWKGDAHAGGYDETTFLAVSRHNRAHYEQFSTLIRETFQDALTRFVSEEIDVLHLDGLHTEVAVRHDLESWLPKLQPGGILLMHDVSVRSHGFGVWKVWEELERRGRSWRFSDGPGLGVWQKPPACRLTPPFEALLTAPNESSAALAEYYRERAAGLSAQISQHWQDGSIRHSPAAAQTVIQVFFSRDGTHREEDSVYARIGHEGVKELQIAIPSGGWTGGLRVDFVSALTTIEILQLDLLGQNGDVIFRGATDELRVGGDAVREPGAGVLRLRITGIDPQVYLPPVMPTADRGEVSLRLKLRVLTTATSADPAAELAES